MSDCTGPNCTHPAHAHERRPEPVPVAAPSARPTITLPGPDGEGVVGTVHIEDVLATGAAEVVFVAESKGYKSPVLARCRNRYLAEVLVAALQGIERRRAAQEKAAEKAAGPGAPLSGDQP